MDPSRKALVQCPYAHLSRNTHMIFIDAKHSWYQAFSNMSIRQLSVSTSCTLVVCIEHLGMLNCGLLCSPWGVLLTLLEKAWHMHNDQVSTPPMPPQYPSVMGFRCYCHPQSVILGHSIQICPHGRLVRSPVPYVDLKANNQVCCVAVVFTDSVQHPIRQLANPEVSALFQQVHSHILRIYVQQLVGALNAHLQGVNIGVCKLKPVWQCFGMLMNTQIDHFQCIKDHTPVTAGNLSRASIHFSAASKKLALHVDLGLYDFWPGKSWTSRYTAPY